MQQQQPPPQWRGSGSGPVSLAQWQPLCCAAGGTRKRPAGAVFAPMVGGGADGSEPADHDAWMGSVPPDAWGPADEHELNTSGDGSGRLAAVRRGWYQLTGTWPCLWEHKPEVEGSSGEETSAPLAFKLLPAPGSRRAQQPLLGPVKIPRSAGVYEPGACARACARACMRACVRAVPGGCVPVPAPAR
jgi:hypothetical protein